MLRFDVLGTVSLASAIDSINRFTGEVRSVKPALERAVDEVVRPAIRSNFENETARGYYDWAELSEFTELSRIRQGYPPGPILDRKRGAIGLKYAAQQKNIWTFDGQAGEAFVKKLPDRVWYGSIHEAGTDKIPQREFFVINKKDMDDIAEILEDWYGGKVQSTIGTL